MPQSDHSGLIPSSSAIFLYSPYSVVICLCRASGPLPTASTLRLASFSITSGDSSAILNSSASFWTIFESVPFGPTKPYQIGMLGMVV